MKKLYATTICIALIFTAISTAYPKRWIVLQKQVLMSYELNGVIRKDVTIKYEYIGKKSTEQLEPFYLPVAPNIKNHIKEVLVNDKKRKYQSLQKMFPLPYKRFGKLYVKCGNISSLDIVTIKYRQIVRFSPIDGYFWGKESVSQKILTKEFYLRFSLPAAVKLRYSVPKECDVIEDRIKDGKRIIVVKGKNLSSEDGSFVYSSFPSWSGVAKWVHGKIKDAMLDGIPTTVLKEISPLGDKEKIVKKLIKGIKFVPISAGMELPYIQHPRDVWRYKKASLLDSAILVLSAARKMKLKSDYFISGDYYKLKDYPPSPSLLTRSMVEFEIRGNKIWYVSGSIFIHYDYPTPPYQGKDAISVDGLRTLPISSAEENYNELDAELFLSKKGEISGKLDMSVSGYWNRKDYNWLKAYNYQGSIKPEEKEYSYRYRFAAIFAKNKATLNIPFFKWKFLENLKRKLLSSKNRAIIIPSTAMLKEVITIYFPKGYKAVYTPKNIELSYDEGSIKVKFINFKGHINAVLLLKINRRMIEDGAKRHILVLISIAESASKQNILLSK